MKWLVEIASLSLLYWLDWVFPLFEGRRDRLRHALPNVGTGLLNALVVSLVFSSVIVRAMELSSSNSFGLLHRLNLEPRVEGVLAFVLFDLWMYLWHVANHQWPFFWRFHRMHHSDLQVDATTALRFHTGEIFFSSIARLAVIPLIGMSWIQLMIYEICLQPVILFHHSNVALPEKWDRLFRSVLATPNMHRVHHSQETDETNSNYSSIFSFWDRLARTFRRRDDTRTLRYGLPYLQEREWQSFSGMLKTPLANLVVLFFLSSNFS
jgi:sterol desaturase/sphingolipid hydroxylase (fatty acid hydroxylase superfamily)